MKEGRKEGGKVPDKALGKSSLCIVCCLLAEHVAGLASLLPLVPVDAKLQLLPMSPVCFLAALLILFRLAVACLLGMLLVLLCCHWCRRMRSCCCC